MSTGFDWEHEFRRCYERACERYQQGDRHPVAWFDSTQQAFLRSIGVRPHELLDYAEDAPELSYGDALLIVAVRREFFLHIQCGQWCESVVPLETFPPKDAALAGWVWLPRIVAKARARLRGVLPPELMYGCGGDRAFLRRVGMHPADFLRLVWQAGNDDHAVVRRLPVTTQGPTASKP
ncbi:MAG: DUF5069 domain-containing protein [Verrucomicrobiae bacterium]|nr:DUF5069 domain-containing protein [Verrucomicrobiae bacterium]MDW8345179.1 DUF5069 domain-containing protein [Verrucomicrobiae bacterium]